jgi:hypothetical protein
LLDAAAGKLGGSATFALLDTAADGLERLLEVIVDAAAV